MTRILHVVNGAGGGSTLSTTELARRLVEHGFEPHVVCDARIGTSAERQVLVDAFDGRVEFVPMYYWNRRVRTRPVKRALVVARQELTTGHGLWSAARLRSIIDARRIDLVHTATLVAPDGAVAARSLGVPHVFHVRELFGENQPFRIAGEGRRLARVLGGDRNRMVANSRTTADALRQVAPGLDVEIVPNGLDLSRFDHVADRHDESRPVRVVAMVGHLYSTLKRHDLFVDAAAIVARRHPELEFRIYGHREYAASDAYMDDLVQRAAAEGLTSKLVLAGYAADPTVMMGEIDLLVQPNSTESFGRVVVEAMASNVAVVGVRAGPLGELVEHERSGLLASASTPAALAEVIERAVEDDELRAKAIAAARLRAHELFSIERCADRMAAIYEAQLSAGRGEGEPLVRSWARFAAGRFAG
jgi:glycosyltransferase involved in cell wall biosynthesis